MNNPTCRFCEKRNPASPQQWVCGECRIQTFRCYLCHREFEAPYYYGNYCTECWTAENLYPAR